MRRQKTPARVFGALALLGVALVFAAPICGSPDETPTPAAEQPGVEPSPTTAPSAPPAETSTPLPSTFGYEETVVLATPASPSDAMFLGGELWVDGGVSEGEVVAYIAGRECGRGQSISTGDAPVFAIRVASDAEVPGCGMPGVPVTLTINGRAMNDTVAWQPGFQQPLTLFAGPVVARYIGYIRFDAPFSETNISPQRVIPYIDDIVCGGQLNPMQGNGEVGYEIAVMPEELKPGCGREGAVITLRLELMAAGTSIVVDLGQVPWQPGRRVELPAVDLASSAILQPTATAGAPNP